MRIPTVTFKEMSLEENIKTIEWAIDEDNGSLDVHQYVIDYYPELSILKPTDSKEKKHNLIKEVVTKDYNTYYEKIKNEVKRYNEIWHQYNDLYFNTLTKYLNISWPENHLNIIASVGLIPVFPRYLETYSFAVSTNLSTEKIIETTAHETCHFLWFNKWQELYPKCPKRHYDSPYIPWQYSEMVVDPILNDPVINKLFNNVFVERAYESFYSLEYENKNVMATLKDIYNSSDSIEEKIKKGYKYLKKVFKKNKNK